jgi:hypothetical protein
MIAGRAVARDPLSFGVADASGMIIIRSARSWGSVRHLSRRDGRRLPDRDDYPRQTQQDIRSGSIRSVSTGAARCSHRMHERVSAARLAGSGPHDFACAVLRVDQNHGLGGQVFRRLGPPGREIAPDGICRVGAGCGRKRTPQKVDAPAGVARRVARVSAELRGAEVPCSTPPGREGPNASGFEAKRLRVGPVSGCAV